MTEDFKNIDEVIIRFLIKDANADEQEYLLRWLKENNANRKYFFGFKETWDASQKVPEIETDESWAMLQKKQGTTISEEKPVNRKTLLPRIMKYAASIIVIVGLGIGLFTLVNLYLKKETPVTYTEIRTLNGQKKEIILPDGTSVWLNSDSYFKYPDNYGKVNREVFLVGEAFFNVTRDESRTFIVNADKLIIKVLGTSFNVNCYPESKMVETTVLSGIVSVENGYNIDYKEVILLNQLEKGTFIKEEEGIYFGKNLVENSSDEANKTGLKKLPLNAEETDYLTSWKDQSLSFNNETFEEVAVKLERWFNVSITLKDENLKNYRYKGKFDNVRSIFQILEVIRLTTPITYEFKENDQEIVIKELKN